MAGHRFDDLDEDAVDGRRSVTWVREGEPPVLRGFIGVNGHLYQSGNIPQGRAYRAKALPERRLPQSSGVKG